MHRRAADRGSAPQDTSPEESLDPSVHGWHSFRHSSCFRTCVLDSEVVGATETDASVSPRRIGGARRSMGQPQIDEYGAIGDAGTLALISKDGSIDWLCWPQFHSPALFARILDEQRGGHCHVQPSSPNWHVRRRYLGETAVLETTFETPGGRIVLTDAMVAVGRDRADRTLAPDHRLLRRVECVQGEVDVEFECDLKPQYGLRQPSLESRGRLGFFYNFGRHVVHVLSEVHIEAVSPGVLRGRERLKAGDVRRFSLGYDCEEPAVLSPLGSYADREFEETIGFWESWAAHCPYDGRYRKELVRSLITLKLLTQAATGAIVAAPTTSLPEKLGGKRNWDYRYCWPRDAVFTVRALDALGYEDHGRAFFEWLMHASGNEASRLQVLFDVFGGHPGSETELPHFRGHAGSKPVRVGNDASSQFQLDIYGEILATAHEYVQGGAILDGWQQDLLRSLGKLIMKRWRDPDAGIWEKRSTPKRHTHSLVMCWAGLTCLLKMDDQGKIKLKGRKQMEQTRASIRVEVERDGYNRKLGTYVDTLGGDRLDASLLLLPLIGFIDATDPKMSRTFAAIDEQLGVGPFLYRYRTDEGSSHDGIDGSEGTFAMCAFWAVEYLTMAGRLSEAQERLEILLRSSNDLGLYGEQIDPESGRALGNYPQAFTHVGLIHAVLRLEKALETHTQAHPLDHTEQPLTGNAS